MNFGFLTWKPLRVKDLQINFVPHLAKLQKGQMNFLKKPARTQPSSLQQSKRGTDILQKVMSKLVMKLEWDGPEMQNRAEHRESDRYHRH